MTINEALIQMKRLAQRQASLEGLRNQVSIREEYFEPKKIQEPLYDLVAVDQKIVSIANAILKIECAIKASNAVTQIDVVVDMDNLFAAIEAMA